MFNVRTSILAIATLRIKMLDGGPSCIFPEYFTFFLTKAEISDPNEQAKWPGPRIALAPVPNPKSKQVF